MMTNQQIHPRDNYRLNPPCQSAEMSEALQKLIIDTLDLHGSISDTRALVLPGQVQSALTSEEQIIILGALNSLLSREVNSGVHLLAFPLIMSC